ncbi:hypothetical protein [Kitasatospora aureofaciens]|uniref:hypothetical protein n=1 Tax=Kitasatospora aureofaciens TaxID=1894 RepID=UPI001C448654|nr:hypothetical protein [Kitasatospora aureofaciens]MBV6697794.1 hypothetical protein [Kitasatospora aureofaciens]
MRNPLTWSTPRLVRALTGGCLAALALAGVVTATILGGARDGTDVIGHQAAPQVVRSADLYFALNDMDAQAANLLLFGADPDFATVRRQSLDTYDQRRAQVATDLQRVAEATADDPAGRTAVQTVLSELGRYEALVARAQLLDDQAHAPAGRPPADALTAYRAATDLLRQRLLPAADSVTAANSATVERRFTAERGDLGSGFWWILGTGVLALGALAGLQRLLAVRYQRLVNVPLAAATLLTVGGLVTGVVLLNRADHNLVVAKHDAYDSVIALSRARATAYDLNADESRFLSDPARAAAYEQSYFDKTQTFARVNGTTLPGYPAALAPLADRHRADHTSVGFGGFLGDELRNITFAGEQDAAERVLATFQDYQRDDRKIRDLNAQGRLKEAIAYDTGTAAGESNADFARLAAALDDVQAVNQNAMDKAVATTDDDLDTITATMGAVLLAAALALTAVGVRSRLREYA